MQTKHACCQFGGPAFSEDKYSHVGRYSDLQNGLKHVEKRSVTRDESITENRRRAVEQ